MDLFVCVGSSCHLKGSRDVISEFNKLIEKYNLKEKIMLKGSFCMGKCGSQGVSVKIDDKIYSVALENIEQFFVDEIVNKL